MGILHIPDVIILLITLLCVIAVAVLHLITARSIRIARLLAATAVNNSSCVDKVGASEKALSVLPSFESYHAYTYNKFSYNMAMEYERNYLELLLKHLIKPKKNSNKPQHEEELVYKLILENSMYRQLLSIYDYPLDTPEKKHSNNEPPEDFTELQRLRTNLILTLKSKPGNMFYSAELQNTIDAANKLHEQLDRELKDICSWDDQFAFVAKENSHSPITADRFDKIATLAQQEHK